MMILSDIFNIYKNNNQKTIENKFVSLDIQYNTDYNKIYRFFIFANRRKSEYGDLDTFLSSHPDICKNCIFILFNKALPLSFQSVNKFVRKWIFFRCLSDPSIPKQLLFDDFNILNRYSFEKFFLLPEFLLQENIHKSFGKAFIENLHAKNIDISLLSHTNIWRNKEHDLLYHRINYGIKPYHKHKDLSSGLWAYIYLKNQYPLSKFTLIGFNSNINELTHSPDIEKKYLIQEHYFSKELEFFQCFDS